LNKLLPLIAFSILLLVPVGAQTAFADVMTLISTQDSYGSSFLPDNTHGSDVNVVVSANPVGMARAFIAFDLSSIPFGSTVTDVELKLNINVGPAQPIPLSVHKITTIWDESTATWNSPWTNPGGDFVLTSSADQTFSGTGFTIFSSTPQMVSDVQSWVDDQSSNNGWLLKRTSEVVPPSIQIVLGADPPNSPGNLPMLTVTFTPPPDDVVGGELLPIETVSLILAGAQSFSWMIPVVLSGIGIGLFVASRKSE